MTTNDEDHDDEGLLRRYDVIVCGTGLVQSIVASALARAGKSVLHCDEKPYYGELDAVLTLPYVLEGHVWGQNADSAMSENVDDACRINLESPSIRLHSTSRLSSENFQVGTEVLTPYGAGTIHAMSGPGSLQVRLKAWELADGSSPTLYVPVPDPMTESLEEHLSESCKIKSQLVVGAEELLTKSSRSFAFDITPTVILGSGAAVQGFLRSGVADYLEFKPIEGLFWYKSGGISRVPCSKADVFATKLLSPLEKRKFMKFLQLVMDYGTSQVSGDDGDEENEETTVEENVQSVNERQLNQGRSLTRPQNKSVSSDNLQLLKDSIEQGDTDFETFLRERQKLSGSLLALVRHALAFETSTTSLSLGEGMDRLCKHLRGLGQFGTTAFLVPLYGSGEFAQSFCRSAAVHGATYLLRRAAKAVLAEDGSVKAVELSNNDDSTKSISTTHVVVGSTALRLAQPKKRVLRRISVVYGKLVSDDTDQRHVLVIPPESSLGNSSAIHGIALDWTVKVAPHNCTLLHLTCTADEGDAESDLLQRTAHELMGEANREIYHVEFSFPIPALDEEHSLPYGLHICHQESPSLVADEAFEQAKTIFESICPEVDFLSLSESMDAMVKERMLQGDDDDEERLALDKAADILDKGEEETQPSVVTKDEKKAGEEEGQPSVRADDEEKVSDS